jgi:2'-5' RNA ligase
MRLFIAIPLPATTVACLKCFVDGLRQSAIGLRPGLRLSDPEDWHITLQFLGSAGQEQFACVLSRLSDIKSTHVAIELGALGVFDRSGVIHLPAAATPALTALQSSILAATQPCGFEPEDRPYRPHVTLARSKGQASELRALMIEAGRRLALESFIAREFCVYESHLSSGGSRYEIRQRFSLL